MKALIRCMLLILLLSFAVTSSHLHDPLAGGEDVNGNVEDNTKDESSPPSLSCRYHYRPNTLPRGKTKVDHLRFLGRVHSYKACADLCCQHGPKCQMGWLFKNKCFAVSCDKLNSRDCHPISVPNGSPYTSSLIIMSFSNKLSSSYSTKLTPSSSSSEISPSVSSPSVIMTSSKYVPGTTTSISVHVSPTVTMVTSSSKLIKETPILPRPPSHHKLHHFRYKTLSVAVDNTHPVITLPVNHMKIFSSTWPHPSNDNTYHYQWKKLFGPNKGHLHGIHDKTISLTRLVSGKYGLEVIVYDDKGNYGNTFVNITVRPKPHANKSPQVVISPSNNVTLALSDKLILDASKTTDDADSTENLLYQWELVSGPLQGVTIGKHESWNKPLLTLQHLKIGLYIFKLSVTDSDGAVGVAHANVTVQAEPDYPPTANAGESVLIHLPHNEVILDASKSKDDKGIVKYSWTQIKGNQVEMKGIKNRTLVVSKLEVGVYQFELTVTDTSGQSASTTVTVDVQEEDNQPPVATLTNAGNNVSVYYPNTKAMLNGSLSTDDYKIVQYNWTQLNGPTDITLKGLDSPVLHMDHLHIDNVSPTVYTFQLTVVDYRNLTNSTRTSVLFHKGEQVLPIANAGPDITITLPQRAVILNGSSSYDGFGIRQYEWIKSDTSPAIGGVVDGGGHTVMLTDLINGTYNYTLVVTNSNGKINKDEVTVTVKEDPLQVYVVEVYIDANIFTFTKKNLEKVSEQLVLRIGELHYQVIVRYVQPHDQHILIGFYVQDTFGNKINASLIYDRITSDGQEFQLDAFKVFRVEESVCQNPCSYHGHCDLRSKKCVCSTFWMENPFTAHFGSRHSNCDWSVLYVVLVIVGVVIILSLCTWLCCCCIMHRRRSSRRRRVKYAILDHSREERGRTRILPQGYNKNSLIVSETETEEEILFESTKKGKKTTEKQALIQPTNVKNNLLDSTARTKKTSNIS